MTQQTEPPQANDFEQDPYAVRLFDLCCKRNLPQGVILTLKNWIGIRYNMAYCIANERWAYPGFPLGLSSYGAPTHYDAFAEDISEELIRRMNERLSDWLDRELTRIENAD